MRLLPRGPVAVASRAWHGAREPMRTVVARVTYDLRPVRCEVALRPEPVRTEDRWVEGSRGGRWLRDASDLAPMKESADVVVVGRAHAPGPSGSTEVAIRLVVGEVDKTLRVTGARRWGADGSPLPPATFRDAPIDWTQTAGGPDTWNPIGIGDVSPDLRGESPAPTVLAFGAELERRGAYVAPAGLGPLAPTWAPRRDSLPTDAAAWLEAGAAASPMWNENVRPSFFQVAPPDQRLPRPLRDDERLVLEGLLAGHPRLVTNLPGLALHAVAVDAAGGQHRLALQADTMLVDAERGLVVVTHRAAMPARVLDGRDVFVWLEGHDAHVAQDIADAAGETADAASARRERPDAGVATPFEATGHDDDDFERLAMGTIASVDGPAVAAMPFARAAAGPPPAPPPPAAPIAGASTVSRTAPAAEAIVAPPLAPPPPVTGGGWSSSWPASPAMGPSAPVAAPPPLAQPPIVAPPSVVSAPSVERIDTWKLHEQAAARRAPGDGGVEARPPAAPATTESAPEASAPAPRAVPVETVWLEPPSEIERAARSSTLRAQLGDDDGDDWMTPGEAGGSAEDRARRDVARWLRAAPLPLDRLPETLSRALEKDAAERPYVMIAGELTWSFDAREAIRAWIALGTPLAAEPRVKSAIEAAEVSLQEHLVPIPDVLAASLERLKDAVRGVAKLVGATPLDTAAERYLIEERGFARRRVWGQSRLRAQLQARGARFALPVYLPESAGWEAPLAQKIQVRLVGELRSRQDPLEPMMVCLRGIAMGVELLSGSPG